MNYGLLEDTDVQYKRIERNKRERLQRHNKFRRIKILKDGSVKYIGIVYTDIIVSLLN